MFTCLQATYLAADMGVVVFVGAGSQAARRQTNRTHKFMTKTPDSQPNGYSVGARFHPCTVHPTLRTHLHLQL